jgi:spartin
MINSKCKLFYSLLLSRVGPLLLLQGMYSLATKVADYSTPHVKAFADRHLPTSVTKKDKQGTSKAGEAVKVAHAGLTGFANVWTSMESAGLTIAKSLSAATVDTVNHKYGEDAARSTGYAMNSGINLGKTALNVNNMGVKMMAKKVAKDTGKQVLKEYSSKNKGPTLDKSNE